MNAQNLEAEETGERGGRGGERAARPGEKVDQKGQGFVALVCRLSVFGPTARVPASFSKKHSQQGFHQHQIQAF
jgi:hypothetical protein